MTFEQAEKFRWNPFDVTKVIHLWTCEQFVL
jgi:catalase